MAAILAVCGSIKVLQWCQRVVLGVVPFGVSGTLSLVDVAIGLQLAGSYTLYFLIARTFLAPFDCSGSGNVFTMDAEPSIKCDGNPTHARMVLVAALSIAVYGVGIPVMFASVLARNRAAIVADQVRCNRSHESAASLSLRGVLFGRPFGRQAWVTPC